MLVTIIFSFSNNFFIRLFSKGRYEMTLSSKGLKSLVYLVYIGQLSVIDIDKLDILGEVKDC